MHLGDELVKEQLFFRRELKERVHWLIRLRWFAAGTALISTWMAYLWWPILPVLPASITILFIVLYNIAFQYFGRHIEADPAKPIRAYTVFAHTQITCDFIALYLLIYLTGGIHSPLLIFLFFHIFIAGILLSPLSCFLYCCFVTAASSGLMVLQVMQSPLLHPPVFHSSLWLFSPEFPEILVPFALFTAALFFAAYLVTSLKSGLQIKGRELLRVSREMDASNAKLSALYRMVTNMGTCSDLQTLMDSATRNAAQIMGVKACSIKLLDEQKERLTFASTYGLSDSYVKSKNGIDIAQSPINREIIEGSLSAIGEIDEKDYFQYPEDISKEGIASLVCLPLTVEKIVLGVFCVYSAHSHSFSDDDVHYFSLMADLTALSIKNLKRDLDKTWFLQKAAHQLRSPLNTVLSMLNLLKNRHCGPVTPEQDATLDRSIRRLKILGDVVVDLLKLGIQRSDLYKTVLRPIAPGIILNRLKVPYQTLAAEKKVNLTFETEPNLPCILADEQLVDDLFTNLISNAVKYTPPEGWVQVVLAYEGDWVRFEVRDSGIGIPAGDIPDLFTEFFRSANARAFVEEGTGLGLVVVKQILDRLKGTISVNSTVGKGTRFICRLPIAPEPPRERPGGMSIATS